MDPELRNLFDTELERVLPELPQQVRELLDEVPLIVEDYPSAAVMQKMGVRHRGDLCGLYTGIPRIERSVEHWGTPSDVIHLFRQGILSMARRSNRSIDRGELRRQIRMTILHEYGHHYGLTEDDLRELGYG